MPEDGDMDKTKLKPPTYHDLSPTTSPGAGSFASQTLSPLTDATSPSSLTSASAGASPTSNPLSPRDVGSIQIKEEHVDGPPILTKIDFQNGHSVAPGERQLPKEEKKIHPIVKLLLDCEPPQRMANHQPQVEETEESLMTSMVKLADTELVDVINWAKSVPGKAFFPIKSSTYEST